VRIAANPGRFLPVVVIVALLVVLARCTGDRWWPTGVTATTAASAATLAPPPLAELCGGPTTRSESFWLSAPGGAQLYAAVVGTGPATAVFVHELGPRGLCGFWAYADWLARTKGVRSLLFSQCGAGASQCPPGKAADQWLAGTTAAVTWVRAQGAGQVTLVGASVGGVVALQVAASIRPPVAAVVNLSGERRRMGLGGTRWRPLGAWRCRRCSLRLRGTALSAWPPCGSSMRLLRSGPSGWWCWPRARVMAGSCSAGPPGAAGRRWR
jgi:pimeloyl-ACP methyl ester carboxylesterase